MVRRRDAAGRGARRHQALVPGGPRAGPRAVGVRPRPDRDEYFFTTAPTLMPAVIGYYCGRWNIETTFEEARSPLGLETNRGRCRNTVLRAAPCLLGLYAVVAVLFAALPAAKRVGAVSWPGKATVTFWDAMCAVRRWLWHEAVLPQAGDGAALQKLPEPIRERLLTTLAPACGRESAPARQAGWPRAVDTRGVVDAIRSPNRAGCHWDILPHDLPPKSTVHEYLAGWRAGGPRQRMLDMLREAHVRGE